MWHRFIRLASLLVGVVVAGAAAAQTVPLSRLDLNVDGTISTLDSFVLRQCFGKPAACDPRADFDDDGTIGLKDLNLLTARLGAAVPPPSSSILASNVEASVDKPIVAANEGFVLKAVLRGFNDPSPRFRWYLPDGTTADGAQVSRSLAAPGIYSVGLAVRLSNGAVIESGVTVTVLQANGQAPSALRIPARPGDIDASGGITLVDAMRTYRFVAGANKTFTQTQRDAADMDRDGTVSDEDARQILLGAISGSPYIESTSPRLLRPGTIVTIRSGAFAKPGSELSVRFSGSTTVQRPTSFVPGIATVMVPYDIVVTAPDTPLVITVLEGSVERAVLRASLQPGVAPVANPQAVVTELLQAIRQALINNTLRVGDRALAAGLTDSEQQTLRTVALAGERQGVAQIDILIRLINGPGGRRAAQVFAAALQANGYEDLPAAIALLRSPATQTTTPAMAALRKAMGASIASAADTACDAALAAFCPLKTIASVLDNASFITQIGCTSLLAGLGAAVLFPGDGPLIDVAALSLWVATCSKVQVAIETAATIGSIVGGVDADLSLTASPTRIGVGESSTLTARLNVFGFDELCSLGGSLGAQRITEKLADRIIGRLLTKNTGVMLVKKAFEILGGDFLNTFLTSLRSATSTAISKSSLDIAVGAAAQALCPSGGLCNPLINTKSALTGATAALVTGSGNTGSFTCPAKGTSSQNAYTFNAQKDFCGEPLKAQAEVNCAATPVTFTMGDNGTALDDIYEVVVDGTSVLSSNVPVRSVSRTIELSAGLHTVQMLGRAAPDGIGTYYISISGARIVSGDATNGTDLVPGAVKTFVIEVQ